MKLSKVDNMVAIYLVEYIASATPTRHRPWFAKMRLSSPGTSRDVRTPALLFCGKCPWDATICGPLAKVDSMVLLALQSPSLCGLYGVYNSIRPASVQIPYRMYSRIFFSYYLRDGKTVDVNSHPLLLFFGKVFGFLGFAYMGK